MTSQNISPHINALKKAFKAPRIPRSFCVTRDGRTLEYHGFSVLTAFLDGEIESVVCDDADMAQLLRAMDTDGEIQIDVAWLDGEDLHREII